MAGRGPAGRSGRLKGAQAVISAVQNSTEWPIVNSKDHAVLSVFRTFFELSVVAHVHTVGGPFSCHLW